MDFLSEIADYCYSSLCTYVLPLSGKCSVVKIDLTRLLFHIVLGALEDQNIDNAHSENPFKSPGFCVLHICILKCPFMATYHNIPLDLLNVLTVLVRVLVCKQFIGKP